MAKLRRLLSIQLCGDGLLRPLRWLVRFISISVVLFFALPVDLGDDVGIGDDDDGKWHHVHEDEEDAVVDLFHCLWAQVKDGGER